VILREYPSPEFEYRLEPSWPPLAWLAIWREDEPRITVRHGPDVETRPGWFCEAVWEGDFAAGNFDECEFVFGSGGRIRNGSVFFVSSHLTFDRLQSFRSGEQLYVSNSLACLAAVLEFGFDPWYPWYYEDFSSICQGLDKHRSHVQSDLGAVQLVYHRNLEWDGARLRILEKPANGEKFVDFASYRNYLETILVRLGANIRAPQRSHGYTPLSTCSSGYDSLAVTVLSRAIGNQQALCVPHDRLYRDDNGADLVRRLGMQPLVIARDDWRREPFSEVPFIVGDACGRDVWLAGAQVHLRRRVLLTGKYGGAIWHWPSKGYGPELGHNDPAGLSLTEYRLQAGFLHCPVPAIGARLINTVQEISGSNEMLPWSLGGSYDRPVPRRIIEEAGIERGTFAKSKAATGIQLFRRAEFDRFLPGTRSFGDFMRWIREKSRVNPPPATAGALETAARVPVEVPLFRHLFPWALDRWKARYAP
jgi:hypothetical protein